MNNKNITKIEKFESCFIYIDIINKIRKILFDDILENNNIDLNYENINELNNLITNILLKLFILKIIEVKNFNIKQITREFLENLDQYYEIKKILKNFDDIFNNYLNNLKINLFKFKINIENIKISKKCLKEIRKIINIYFDNKLILDFDLLGLIYECYLEYEPILDKHNKIILHKDEHNRKRIGIYYTPNYIVDFILNNSLKIKLDSLWNKILYFFEKKDYIKLKETFKQIENIRILDPSCGTGVFLIKTFDLLKNYYKKYNKLIDKIKLENIKNTQNFDLNKIDKINSKIIKNNLYGVDIDLNAIELTKLNLLIRAYPEVNEVLPLIDENIKIGNSLITGFDKCNLDTYFKIIKNLCKFRVKIKELLNNINCYEIKHLLFIEYYMKNKLNFITNKKLTKFFKDLDKIKPFNWEIEFPEVFNDGGFDIIIGNPPYINMQKTSHEIQTYFSNFSKWKDVFRGESDISYYFIINGIKLLKENGILSYILERYWLEATYGDKLREFIINNCKINYILDFSKMKIFLEADNHVCIINLQKCISKYDSIKNNYIKVILIKDRFSYNNFNKKLLNYNFSKHIIKLELLTRVNKELLIHISNNLHKRKYEDRYILISSISQKDLDLNLWKFLSPIHELILRKIEDSNPLLKSYCIIGKGMDTGYNKAFIVSKNYVEKYNLEKELLHPYIKNSDILPFYIRDRDEFLIYTENIENIENYPHIKKHLEKFKIKLENRSQKDILWHKWYKFRAPQNKDLFEKASEKLIVPYRASKNKFALDNRKRFTLTDTYIIVLKPERKENLKYLLGILNSNVINFYFKNKLGKKKGNLYEYLTGTLSYLPIKSINFSDPDEKNYYDLLISIVDRLIILNKKLYRILELFEKSLESFLHNKRYICLHNYLNIDKKIFNDFLDKKLNKRAINYKISLKFINDDYIDIYNNQNYKVICKEIKDFIEIKIFLNDKRKYYNILTVEIPNLVIRKFLFFSIKLFLFKHDNRIIGNKIKPLEIIRFIKIPVFSSIPENNEKNIFEMMKKFFALYANVSIEEIKFNENIMEFDIDITKIEENIDELYKKLNDIVYKLYKVEDFKNIIEKSID